jgi:hypothetical protein
MAADLNAWTLEFARATPGCLPRRVHPEPASRATSGGARRRTRRFRCICRRAASRRTSPGSGGVGAAGRGGCPRGAPARAVATAHTGPGPFAVLLAATRVTAIVAHLGAPTMSRPGPRRDVRAGGAGHHHGVHAVLRAAHPVPPGRCRGRGPWPGRKVLLGSDFPNIPYPRRAVVAWYGWAWVSLAARRLLGQRRRHVRAHRRPVAGRPFPARHSRGGVAVSAPRQARWSRRPMTKANPYSTPITISRKW